jgi:sulfur carrier protein
MILTVNGESREFKNDICISELIVELGLKVAVMAVAVNMNIVKKDDWDSFILSENDKVEMLQFVGGG